MQMRHCQHHRPAHCHQLCCSACRRACWVGRAAIAAAAAAALAHQLHQLLLLLQSHPTLLQLLLPHSSKQTGWAACRPSVHAAAAPAALSAGLPLRLLQQLHPALADVKAGLLLLLLQCEHPQLMARHLAAQPLPATCRCTACGAQEVLQGLLQSAACSPPGQYPATQLLLLLLLLLEDSAPLLLTVDEQPTATSCSRQSACLEAPEHHCQPPQQLLLQLPLQTALHLRPCQAWIHCALAGLCCQTQLLPLHHHTQQHLLQVQQTATAALYPVVRYCCCCCFLRQPWLLQVAEEMLLLAQCACQRWGSQAMQQGQQWHWLHCSTARSTDGAWCQLLLLLVHLQQARLLLQPQHGLLACAAALAAALRHAAPSLTQT
jgi:hypothetical protein